MHLTQPAVSIQLKNFQDQFDIPLTEIIGRQLYVTDFGKEIAEAAQKIIHEVEAINYRTLAYKGILTGRLRISVASTGKYVMPYFLSDFLRAHPGVDLNMDVTNKSHVVQSLRNNEVDFALVSVLPDNVAVKKVKLMENILSLVGAESRAATYKRFDRRVLEKMPFIFREPGSATRQAMERCFEEHRVEVLKKMELMSNEAVKQAVIAGLGYTIMSLIGIKNELQTGVLKIIPLKGLPVRTNWNLIWLKDKKLSPVAQAYLSFLEAEKERIIGEHFQWLEKY